MSDSDFDPSRAIPEDQYQSSLGPENQSRATSTLDVAAPGLNPVHVDQPPLQSAGEPSIFDPSRAVPEMEYKSSEARNLLKQHIAGEIDLPRNQLERAVQLSQEGKGAWERAYDWMKPIVFTVSNPVKLAQAAIGAGTYAARLGYGVGEEYGKDVKEAALSAPDKWEQGVGTGIASALEPTASFLKKSTFGVASGLAKMIPVTGGVAGEIADLATSPFGVDTTSQNAGLYQFEHDMNQGIHSVGQAIGVDEKSPTVETSELASMALLPGGAEKAAAPLIAKGADAAVELGTKVAGGALKGAAVTAEKVGPAALATAEVAHGHPWAALGTLLAGYTDVSYFGKIKHLIMDRGIGGIKIFADAMMDTPRGENMMEFVQDGLYNDARNIDAKIADQIAKTKPEDLADIAKMNPDGTSMYTVDSPELSPQAKKVLNLQNQAASAKQNAASMGKYVAANQILSDTTKYALRTAGNLGVAGTTGAAAFTSAAAAPEDREAEQQGLNLGIGLGLLGVRGANKEGVLAMNKSRLLKDYSLPEDHILASEHSANMAEMPKPTQGYINTFSALSSKNSGKHIIVLKPDEMVAALKEHEGVDVAKAPNGFDGKNATYVNADTLASGVVPHEVIHGTGIDSDPELVQAIAEMQSNPENQPQLQKAIDKYNIALQKNRPGKSLSIYSTPKEIAAALGADMLTTLPPEAIYGGRSGGAIIKKWITEKFGAKENSTTAQYGFPVTTEMKSAMENALYATGKTAEQGIAEKSTIEPESVKQAEPAMVIAKESKVNKEIKDQAVAAMKALGIVDPVAKVKSVMQELGPDATLEEVVRKSTQRAIPKPIPEGLSKIHPIMDESGVFGLLSEEAQGKLDTVTQALQAAGVPKSEADPHSERVLAAMGESATPEEIVAQVLKERSRRREMAAQPSSKDLSDISLMPASKSDTIDRPASKISDIIFPGTPRQAKVAAKKYGLSDAEIQSTHQPGFVTVGGEFLSPEEARLHGEERGQLPESTKDKLTPENLTNERMFMPSPSDHPDALDVPAIKRKSDGKVYKAKDAATPHWQMALQNPELQDRYTSGGVDRYIDGWATNSGEFLDKKQGHARAIEQKQISLNFKTEYKGALSSLDLREGGQFMPSGDHTVTVNIGLNANEGGKITPEEALAALSKHGITVPKFSIHQSETEPTLVADLSRPLTLEEAHQVSLDLKQEAIAQHSNGQGELYGPGADKWKPFNPDYFLTHEGRSLSSALGQPHEAPVNAPGSRISRPDLSGVTIRPKVTKLDSESFKGKTIESGEEPWSIRLKELSDKEWNGEKLSDAEEKEFTELHKEAAKNYGSYQNWFEKMGGERDYLDKVFGSGHKNAQFMPSDEELIRHLKSENPKNLNDLIRAMKPFINEVPATWELSSDHIDSDGRQYFQVKDSGGQIMGESYVKQGAEVEAIRAAITNVLYGMMDSGQLRLNSDGVIERLDESAEFTPSPHIEREADRLGLAYKGDMGNLHLYNDPVTRSTIAIKANADRGELQKKLIDTRDRFQNALFMPGDTEDYRSYIMKTPLYEHDSHFGKVYVSSNRPYDFNKDYRGQKPNGFTLSNPNQTNAEFLNPLIAYEGDVSYIGNRAPGLIRKAKEEGKDGVVILNAGAMYHNPEWDRTGVPKRVMDATKTEDNAIQFSKEHPDEIDWENPRNIFIPTDKEAMDKVPDITSKEQPMPEKPKWQQDQENWNKWLRGEGPNPFAEDKTDVGPPDDSGKADWWKTGEEPPQFMPSSHPDAIKEAAVRYKDGEIYTGRLHSDALTKAYNGGRHYAVSDTPEGGYVTNDGEFLDREGARQRAVRIGQMEDTVVSYASSEGRLESTDLDLMRKFMPSDPWSKIHEHLTKEEHASIRDRDKQRIITIFNKLPSIAHGVKTALAGQDQRSWYRNSAEAISRTFGPDADRFAALLAALSPQVSVEANLNNAVAVWNRWLKDGRPTDKAGIASIISNSLSAGDKDISPAAWINNAHRALSEYDPRSIKLSGPKVDSFMRNLRNETQEVTNDRWMGHYGFGSLDAMTKGRRKSGEIEGKGLNYLALNAHVRAAAKALTKRTGEEWTPSDTQAAIWSWIKSRSAGTPVADVPEFSKLLRDIKPLDKLPAPENPF